MRKICLVLCVKLIGLTSVFAQNFTPCATDETYNRSVILHPELIKIEEKANETARTQMASLMMNKAGVVKIVPVVFHIIHQNGTENISQAQIMDQIRILNEDYRKKAGTNGGSSTNTLAADMEIEFRLAQYDPSGKKHDGINRVYNTMTVNADDNVKALSYWDSNKYFNIWVVSSISNLGIGNSGGTVLGYAQFPTQRNTQPLTDGVIIRADQIGVIGTGDLSQAGRTLTHEAGHWLGLYHPFQNGCGSGSITSSNCNSTGDQVCDTPPVKAANYGACVPNNSCTNDVPNLTDLVNDYMDYADGTCMNVFTTGQKTRVYAISFTGAASNTNRVNAASATNLNSTGLDVSGSYLTVNSSITKAPYSYDFENATLVSDGWIINNFNTPSNGWQLKLGVSQSGNNCLSMHNFTNTLVPINSRDGFQSPEIDITGVANPYLSFYYAYTQKSTANTDVLNVMVTNSFGMDETNIFSLTGGALATSPNSPTTNDFTPLVTEWKLASINLSSYKTYSNARFRFEFINRRGNNIYIDNFKITDGSILGVDEAIKESFKFSVQPNPMSQVANISFELKENAPVKISIIDIMGREVMIPQNAPLQSGAHNVNINKNDLSRGMYFIRFEAGSQTFNHKLLVN